MFGSVLKRMPTLEERLARVTAAGIRLLPGVTVAAFLTDDTRADYDRWGDRHLLKVLGGEPPLCENVWYLDMECIDGDDAYLAVAERVKMLACGDLALTDIRSVADDAGERILLSFELDGYAHEWECTVSGDWIDPSILSEFATLLTVKKTGRRIAHLDMDGQDAVFAGFTPAELNRVNEVTDLNFVWLE